MQNEKIIKDENIQQIKNLLVIFDCDYNSCCDIKIYQFLNTLKFVCKINGIDCRLVGVNYPDYIPNMDIEEISKYYFGNMPEWIFGSGILNKNNEILKLKQKYKNIKYIDWNYDMHVDPQSWYNLINDGPSDIYLMRYYYATGYFSNLEDLSKINMCQSIDDWPEKCKYIKVDKDFHINHIKKPWFFFPLSVDEYDFRPLNSYEKKEYDVSILGAITKYYPIRYDVYNKLPKEAIKNNWKIFCSSNPPNDLYFNINKILCSQELRKKYKVGPDFSKLIRESKIFIFDCSVNKTPIGKFFEAMMSGTCILSNEPFHSEEIGLIDNKTFIKIDENNWLDKIKYYLNNEKEREEIAQNARKMALSKHTHYIRATQFISIIKQFQGW